MSVVTVMANDATTGANPLWALFLHPPVPTHGFTITVPVVQGLRTHHTIRFTD
jgi:hypothetical protein